MQYVKSAVLNLKELLFKTFLFGVLTFIICAFLFQVFMMVLTFSGKEEQIRQIVNELTVRLDGRWSDNPNSI